MRSYTCYALSISVAAAFLVGCGGSQASIGATAQGPEVMPSHTLHRLTSSYRVLYSFPGHPKDGFEPRAGLLNVNGALYGTTRGDNRRTCDSNFGCGTVFSLTTGGVERVLHTFDKGTDGRGPVAGLIDVDGTLYGATAYGGAAGDGAVFSITTSGKERVLHSFAGGSDGATPTAALLDVNGMLYGTTEYGGGGSCRVSTKNVGCGTVYAINTSGAETVLHSFTGGKGDGAYPAASLINVRGALYGTTVLGGKFEYGTVFRISTTGEEHVLHNFGNGEGDEPAAALLDVNGVLYGTTSSGSYYPGGAVFSITTTGKEHQIHTFGIGDDGKYPEAALADVNGTLYGTTESGGENGYGTLFSVSTTGEESVLHSFGNGNDGSLPMTPLLDVNGALYGTTYAKGNVAGSGTVFTLMP